MMNEKCLEYFSSLNPIAKKCTRDLEAVKHILCDDWERLSNNEREKAIDDFFVDHDVRKHYAMRCGNHDEEYPSSFPKLLINHGEKIIVDMDSDFWTWQDYHSAPFSWKSKSQQDLSLNELDDKTPKSSSKPVSKKTEFEIHPAPKQFVVNSDLSIWNTDKYKNWKEKYNNFIQTERRNNMFSNEDKRESSLSKSAESLHHSEHAKSVESLHHLEQAKSAESLNLSEQAKTVSLSKSSLTSKLKLSSSFSKKNKEECEDLVIDGRKHYPKAHKDIENNVFDNPSMPFQERLMADEESLGSSSNNSSPSHRPLLKEPVGQKMDREIHVPDEPTFACDTYMYNQQMQAENEDVQLLEIAANHNAVFNSQNEALDSSIPRTGFGFLDNW